MATDLVTRPAEEADLPALTRLDYSYSTQRLLHFSREGAPPEHAFRFGWREQSPGRRPSYEYDLADLQRALQTFDLFLVGELASAVVGLLILRVPNLGGAGEITDLGVHRPFRRRGLASALLARAVEHARSRGLRALWVEPQNDNGDAIDFYMARGFRLSGFNDRMYSNANDERQQVTLFLYRALDALAMV